MQKIFILISVIVFIAASAQQPKRPPIPTRPKTAALPPSVYKILRDSCTQLDIVFITGHGGSMSMDNNRSIHGFTSLISTRAADKVPNAKQDGTIMWQIDGRAYLMGELYLIGDSSGYMVFNKNNKEYINAISPDGAGFLKHQGR